MERKGGGKVKEKKARRNLKKHIGKGNAEEGDDMWEEVPDETLLHVLAMLALADLCNALLVSKRYGKVFYVHHFKNCEHLKEKEIY